MTRLMLIQARVSSLTAQMHATMGLIVVTVSDKLDRPR